MESWKPKLNIINNNNTQKPSVKSKPSTVHNNPICPRHPKHIQSPGVCSLCLTERLSQLPISTPTKPLKHHRWSSSSSFSYLSSMSSSGSSSAVHLDPKRKSGGTLKKSRSMAFFSRKKKDKEKEKEKEKEVVEAKRGLWSRLLRRKSNKGLLHSRTTREGIAVAVH